MRKTDRRGVWGARSGTGRGTKVLVAVDGFFEPGRRCVPGELLMPQPPCWQPRCTCEDVFHGVGSHGTAAVGAVRRLGDVPRAGVLAAIAAAMEQHDEFEDPERSAAAFLDEVATIEEHRLVRREEHLLLPFPATARITRAHPIEHHVDDEP